MQPLFRRGGRLAGSFAVCGAVLTTPRAPLITDYWSLSLVIRHYIWVEGRSCEQIDGFARCVLHVLFFNDHVTPFPVIDLVKYNAVLMLPIFLLFLQIRATGTTSDMEFTSSNVQHNGCLPDSARTSARTKALRPLPFRVCSEVSADCNLSLAFERLISKFNWIYAGRPVCRLICSG